MRRISRLEPKLFHPSIDDRSRKIADRILSGAAHDRLHQIALNEHNQTRNMEMAHRHEKEHQRETQPNAILYINLNNGERLF